MTRKHFEALARLIAERNESTFTSETARAGFAEALADLCSEHNACFDRTRFLAACGTHDA